MNDAHTHDEDVFPWQQSYPPGVPHHINDQGLTTVLDVLDQTLTHFSSRPAYQHYGKTLRYHDLALAISQLAAYFSHHLRLRQGDRIALMMPNCLQYPIALFAALRAGLVIVNINPLYTADELHAQLVHSQVRLLITMEHLSDCVDKAVQRTDVEQIILTRIGDLLGFWRGNALNLAARIIAGSPVTRPRVRTEQFKVALKLGRGLPEPRITISPDAIALLQYTGGTTGTTKAAMLTHRNLVANMLQAKAWIYGSSDLQEGREIVMTALPLYHIFAFTINILVFLQLGACNYLITDARKTGQVVRLLRKVRFTAITGVDTLYRRLLDAPGFSQVDFSRLKVALSGGMALQQTTAERWYRLTNTTLIEAYGLTECSPAVCANPLNLPQYNGSIGLPLPDTQVCLQDDAQRILPLDQIGELCVRGPQVMKGYWQRPQETAEVIDADGWFHTGDIARMDNHGFFYLVDRKKEVIVVSGFNVYPSEIEKILHRMPGVREAAAVGVAHPDSGEAVKVVIVKDDPSLSQEDVLGYTRQYLAAYKQPKIIEFRTHLHKSALGKVLRRQLRQPAVGATAPETATTTSVLP